MMKSRSIGRVRNVGRGQAGEGRIGLIIALLVVAAVIYLLMLMIPPRITNAEMEGFVEQQTRQYVVNQISLDQLEKNILAEAARLEIPLQEEAININDSPGAVRVSFKYSIVNTLIGGKEWAQEFDVNEEVPRL